MSTLPSNENNVVKFANQDELAKARETLSAVRVPDLPAEIIARAFMRLQCADVPREPWHWEVCQILQTPQVTGNETGEVAALRTVIARLEDWQNRGSADWCCMAYEHDLLVNRIVAECEAARRGISVTYAESDDPLPKLKHALPSVEQLEASQRALRQYQANAQNGDER
jgi:hypothetical protein